MLTVKKLREQVNQSKKYKKEELKAISPAQLVFMIAEVQQVRTPLCFGVLHDKLVKECRSCKVKKYCEVLTHKYMWHDPNLVAELKEDVYDDQTKTGFKEGSRPDKLIRMWSRRKLTFDQLEELSQTLFASVIDIDMILNHLKKKKMLIKSGENYGIKR